MQHALESRDDEKLWMYHELHQLLDMKNMSAKPAEKQAIDAKMKEKWKEIQKLDETRAQEYEEKVWEEMDKDKERKQLEGLHEIFTFYAKQHMMAGKMPTFDQIEHSN